MGGRSLFPFSIRRASGPAEIRAPSEEQAMKMAAEHAKSAHGIKEITPEIAAKVRSVMRDDAS